MVVSKIKKKKPHWEYHDISKVGKGRRRLIKWQWLCSIPWSMSGQETAPPTLELRAQQQNMELKAKMEWNN